VEAAQTRPHTDFPRRNLALMGVLSLFVLLLIALSAFINMRQNTPGDVSSIAGSGDQIESDPQALAGTEVTIIGNYYEDLLNLFNQSMVPLKERTGINVVFISEVINLLRKGCGERMCPILLCFRSLAGCSSLRRKEKSSISILF
jgi:hypothetical protein